MRKRRKATARTMPKTIKIAVWGVLSAALLACAWLLYERASPRLSPTTLLAPTNIEKFGAQYFIVDSSNNRVIYNDELHNDFSTWKLLGDNIQHPHSIANYQDLYVVEDTESHAVNVYRTTGNGFELVQRIEDIPNRPHRIIWDYASRAFWVIGSVNHTIYKFAITGKYKTPLRLEYSKPLPFLSGYTRSMTIHKGLMYFTPSKKDDLIHSVSYLDDSFAVVDSAPMPKSFIIGYGSGESGNDIFITADNYIYFTANNGHRPAIFRARSWAAAKNGEYENVAEVLRLKGGQAPYYLSEFDGRIWLSVLGKSNGFVSFVHDSQGDISDVRLFHDNPSPKN